MGEPLSLHSGWMLCGTPPQACADPAALEAHAGQWIPAEVPGTVASALRAAGLWSLDSPARDFDGEDWWFRRSFSRAPADSPATILEFAGLATLAQVWLNGSLLLESANMHRAWQVEAAQLLRQENELLICCRSLAAFLARKRPRPRWRAPMLANQQLRWARTTLLGRTPGWSPAAAAVGPWRAIRLGTAAEFAVQAVRARATLDGDDGVVSLQIESTALASATNPRLRATRGQQSWEVPLTTAAASTDAHNHIEVLRIPAVERWWPHTHGDPALYELELLGLANHTVHSLGAVGFRTVQVDTADNGFTVRINDRPVFCRGACWTPLDVVSLDAADQHYALAIGQARTAGMNMLRVGGTMVYESTAFYRECDRQGMLVWQDLMFANMDYPADDAAFAANVNTEVRQFLRQRQGHASLALLCGNSEVEQQAAMWGAARPLWAPELFHKTLRSVADEECPQLPYWPSSTHGGAFPHAADAGTTSYYGVGAYLRDPDDARRANLRFATECLAFANVPEPDTLVRMAGNSPLRANQPRWKERTPRDLGAGWDFDDVRDHYLQRLFGLDPLALRYADHDRYLACSREASAAAMSMAFAEWRRPASGCGGALVWFLRDLRDGAGWGLIDADGSPKSPWYALRRALQRCALLITDEGGNGLALHVLNEGQRSGAHRLEITLYREGETPLEKAAVELTLVAGTSQTLPLAGCFEHFLDLGHAYRFGPAQFDLIHLTLRDAAGAPIAEHCWLPLGLPHLGQHELGLAARWVQSDGELLLEVGTRRYAHAVRIEVPGYSVEDQYFPLAPASLRRLRVQPLLPGARNRGASLFALNALGPVHLPPP